MQKVKVNFYEALKVADELRKRLDPVYIEVVGSLRRGAATVGDVDLVAVSDVPANTLLSLVDGIRMESGGDDRAFGTFMGMPVNLWTCKHDELGAMLFYLTGPSPYVIGYRMKAKRAGMLLNERGLWKGQQLVAARSEAEIYQALGKRFKEPALRGKR